VAKPQPNSKHCFVCGLENPFGLKLRFFDTAPGEVTAQVVLSDNFQGYPGVVHGGIVAAMLDEAAGRAHMSSDIPRFMFTARLNIQYRKNVPVGQPIRLVGRAGKDRGRSAESESAIYNQAGELLAEAQGVMVNIPSSVLDASDPEALGWKIYSPDAWENPPLDPTAQE
jgi:acyl-coenzyme A thioesterase PaaI-like protein